MVTVDRRVIVAVPPDAFFVLVPSRVPGPETVNVRAFVAVVTVLLFASETIAVIKEVELPSAAMVTGSAVLTSLEAEPGVVVTAIRP